MADNGRSYIIDRLKSKRTTIEDFNYDTLAAPPLSMFLSQWDIEELRKIATSLRLSGKLQEKYELIDNICRSRGLVKFGAGTNRVVYRHPEFNGILFKIAMDDIGMKDNPAEFRNQFLLKPFCAKTFEISPCGTVAISERVKPILSREEFTSVAEDVFELLNTWIIGEYAVADCGSKHFMNYGVRNTFGVVLLDYPYVYRVDGKKLYCKAPDSKSPSGYCDGEIDYDDGFNILHCTKCGVKYRVREIAKKIEEKTIVTVDERSSLKMNIKVSGGTHNVNKVETVGGVLGEESKQLTGKDMVKVAPSRPKTLNVRPGSVVTDQSGESSIKLNIHTNSPVNRINISKEIEEAVKTVNGTSVSSNKTEPVEPAKEEKVLETTPVIKVEAKVVPEAKEEYTTPAPAVDPVTTDLAEVDKSNARPAVEFGEKTHTNIEHTSPVYEIEKALDIIISNIKKIDIKEVKDDLEERMFDKLIKSDVNKESLGKLLIKLLSMAAEVNNGLLSDKTLVGEFIEKYYDLVAEYSEDDTKINIALRSREAKPKDVLILVEDAKTVEVPVEESNEETNNDTEETAVNNENPGFKGIAWYSGKRINTSEITPNLDENYDAIVVIDEDGNYLTDASNFLIALDFVDNMSMDDYDIVSKSWLAGVVAENESHGGNPFTKDEEKEAPVGALPQTQAEDGAIQQAMENFVQNEN